MRFIPRVVSCHEGIPVAGTGHTRWSVPGYGPCRGGGRRCGNSPRALAEYCSGAPARCGGWHINDLRIGDFRADRLSGRGNTRIPAVSCLERPTICPHFLRFSREPGVRIPPIPPSRGAGLHFLPARFSVKWGRGNPVVNPDGFAIKTLQPPRRTSNRKPQNFHPGACTPPIPKPAFGAPGWSRIPLFFCSDDATGRGGCPSGRYCAE